MMIIIIFVKKNFNFFIRDDTIKIIYIKLVKIHWIKLRHFTTNQTEV